jgi:hypothetical protein
MLVRIYYKSEYSSIHHLHKGRLVLVLVPRWLIYPQTRTIARLASALLSDVQTQRLAS